MRWILQNEAADGSGADTGGAAGGAADQGNAGAGAAPGGAGPSPSPVDGAAPVSGTTILAQAAAAAGAAAGGAPAAGAPAGGAPDPLAGVPEKFRVYTGEGDDKQLDTAATLAKLGESYGHLERRFRSGDAPPAAASDYALTIPADYAEAIDAEALKSNESFAAFTASLHEAGLSQGQFDLVVGEFIKQGIELRSAEAFIAAEECQATLAQVWSEPGQYEAQTLNAAKALAHYGGEQAEALMQRHGNDPDLLQVLARMGAEIGADRGMPNDPGNAATVTADEVQALQRDLTGAYWNAAHPEHEAAKAKVRGFYERSAGTAPRGPAPQTFPLR